MRIRNRYAKLVTLTFATALLLPSTAGVADDSLLFSANVAPNVLLMVDNSGSMNHVVWHPSFDPDATPACSYWDNDRQYFVYKPGTDFPGPGETYFDAGTWTLDSGDTGDSDCWNTREIFHDPEVRAEGNYTRWSGRYLNWYFSNASELPAGDPAYLEIVATNNGTESTCLGGASYSKYRRARVTAAQQILHDVICQVNAAGEVRFGLAQFRTGSDPEGGYVKVPIDDYTPAQAAALTSAIEALEGEAWTPLAETLYQVYSYFMSRDSADLPVGADDSTKFEEYVFNTSGGIGTAPDDPVQYSCQRNFVLIITDGEPTKDDFDFDSPYDVGFDIFDDVIGDYNDDGEVENQPDVVAPGYETALYLDDVAKFMHENDFRPDLDGPDDQSTDDDAQTIDVYTVGFTTSDFANAVLQKTADVANGLFFHSNNAEELTDAIVSSVTDIIEKSRSFAAATVPAARSAGDGNNFYFASFLPSESEAFWQGSLKTYTFTGDGQILDKNDNCALVGNGDGGQCQAGLLDQTSPPHWNAGEEVPAPESRALYVSKTGVASGARPILFNASNVTADDLGLEDDEGDGPADEIALYDSVDNDSQTTASGASDLEELADEIVDYARGCLFGSTIAGTGDCTDRSWRLGDIFHSNPVVIGPPNAVINDESYFEFAVEYIDRPRVIYAGTNDGFLHGFNAGEYDEDLNDYDRGDGAELFGFMPYWVRQNLKDIPLDSGARDVYGVDGSAQAADVWFYPDSGATGEDKVAAEWHTVLVGGLREGGRQYFALDVTDPEAGNYPAYLWEFPCEANTAACNLYRSFVGDTWSEPVIARLRIGSGGDLSEANAKERWVAIIGGGYAAEGDPVNEVEYDPTDTADPAGRAIFILDVQTGEVLAAKTFTVGAGPENDMRFAIPSAPAVFDLDQDGYADLIYIPDLGGQLWRWDVSEVGDESGGFDNWTFDKVFEAPVYTDALSQEHFKSFYFPPAGIRRQGVLWMGLGSGERNDVHYEGDLATTDDNNRYYVFKDLDPYSTNPSTVLPIEESDLLDVTNTETCELIDTGYFIVGDEKDTGSVDPENPDGREKFITNSVIFFGTILTGSYFPPDLDEDDPCTATGSAFLYEFRFHCGQGVNVGATATAQRRRNVGSGLPTAPRISVGNPNSGDGDGECQVKIMQMTSDGRLGTAEGYEENPTCVKPAKQLEWREREVSY